VPLASLLTPEHSCRHADPAEEPGLGRHVSVEDPLAGREQATSRPSSSPLSDSRNSTPAGEDGVDPPHIHEASGRPIEPVVVPLFTEPVIRPDPWAGDKVVAELHQVVDVVEVLPVRRRQSLPRGLVPEPLLKQVACGTGSIGSRIAA